MNVAPVSFLTNTSSGKNNQKTKSNPSFGLLANESAKNVLASARKLADAEPFSKFAQTFRKLDAVLNGLSIRNDNLTLGIKSNTEGTGIDAFANASAYIFKSDCDEFERVDGKPPHILREVHVKAPTLQGQTIFDVLLSLLADRNGSPISQVFIHNKITDETAARSAAKIIDNSMSQGAKPSTAANDASSGDITVVTPRPILHIVPKAS